MSVMIAANLGRYVIIVTDCRTTWVAEDLRTVLGYTDDYADKMVVSNFGLLCGTGYGTILEGVQGDILSHQISSPDAFLSVVQRWQQRALAEPVDQAVAKYNVKTTSWIIATVADATADAPAELLCLLYHPMRGVFTHYGPGRKVYVCPTADRPLAFWHDLVRRHVPALEVCPPNVDPSENIRRHADMLRRAVAAASDEVWSIGSRCVVAVMLDNGMTAISPPLQPADRLTMAIAHPPTKRRDEGAA